MPRAARGAHAAQRPDPEPLHHVPSLDGVRGLAVCGVLAFHAGYLHGGYLGVDLFFTLSGFLITRLIIDDLVRDRFSPKQFWARRARRLLPAAWVLIGAVLLAAPMLVRATELASVRGDSFATLGYVANWWQIATSSSYFAMFNTPSPLQHTWSLAIEEQFYVLWPVVLVVLWKIGRRSITVLAIAAGALASASLVAGVLLYRPSDDGARVYYGTDTRAASILIGAIAAIIVWRCGPQLAKWRAGEWWSCLAMIVLAVAWVHGDSGAWLYQGGLAGLALLSALVLAVVTTQAGGYVHQVLTIRPLVAVGVISYGVYLYHWPLFLWLSPERTGLDGVPLFALRVVATFAVASASYFLIERPYRRRRWAFSLRTAGAIGAIVVITFAAVALRVPQGLDHPQAAAAVDKISARGLPSQSTPTSMPATLQLPPLPAPHRLLVVGDSVGQELQAGFEHQAPPEVSVVNLAKPFCGAGETAPRIKAGTSAVQDACADWRTRWTSKAADMNADGVLVVFGAPTSTRWIDGAWRNSCDPKYDAWMQSTFTDVVKTMQKFGPVWVTLEAYSRYGGMSLPQTDAETDCTNRAFHAAVTAGTSNARLIDLAHFVCPTELDCIDQIDGVRLRPDGLHFAGPGSDIAARWLFTQLGEDVDSTK